MLGFTNEKIRTEERKRRLRAFRPFPQFSFLIVTLFCFFFFFFCFLFCLLFDTASGPSLRVSRPRMRISDTLTQVCVQYTQGPHAHHKNTHTLSLTCVQTTNLERRAFCPPILFSFFLKSHATFCIHYDRRPFFSFFSRFFSFF